jgi:AcrR family transcriptional regulator
MPPTTKPKRSLSTAEERREAILEAAVPVFADRGFAGTPTMAIAKAAGISQAYLFRLFPTKAELAVAVVDRSHERIHAAFAAAAARAKAAGTDVFSAMGGAYVELLRDRTLLLSQLHSHAAAADDPAVREAVRRGFADLVDLVARESGAPDEDIRRFFATGMLLNVMAAMRADEVDAPWARTLLGTKDDSGPC